MIDFLIWALLALAAVTSACIIFDGMTGMYRFNRRVISRAPVVTPYTGLIYNRHGNPVLPNAGGLRHV